MGQTGRSVESHKRSNLAKALRAEEAIADTLSDEYYYVDIETEFEDDFLNIVELKINGKSDKEVILTTYICHPYMASDNVSGMYLLLKLYDALKDKELKYNYRFLFFPETIGSLTALSQELVKPDNVEYSLI